eukprot:TRINITY_DN6158_c0_g2_i1.p1 TRINITY_DN6158_c0_g2~~TRINITY_DN6158_c0_g2_i1.p1  ORF type:complete len:1108 (+),score=375.56 TRINITY_DN6158_c0_g2_i1:39-3362(+)
MANRENERSEKPKDPFIPSKLLAKKEIDEADEQDTIMSKAFSNFQSMTNDLTEKEINTKLLERVQNSTEGHSEITLALLYGILTLPLAQAPTINLGTNEELKLSLPSFEQQGSTQYFSYLNLIVRDNFSFCLSQLKSLVHEKFPKLLENCRVQLLWILNRLISLRIPEVDELIVSLLRHISGGDNSLKNLWLIHNCLVMLGLNKETLLSNSLLIPVVLYTFLRLITDHSRPVFEMLRNREVALCEELLTKKFVECSVIGRDLIRLLQDVVKIPTFSNFWKETLQKPASGVIPNINWRQGQNSNMPLVSFLLSNKTPRIYPQCRITPEMDNYIQFMLSKVRTGLQKRHQQWFASKFLSTPESESLIPDILRFICCCVHPSNAILGSDVLPRWVFIGWLLGSIKSSHMRASARLSLFYDWLFYDPKMDNIMNIEPGMLLMINSVSKHTPMAASLIEFLVREMEFYDPTKKSMIKSGVYNSLGIMLRKGVVNTLAPLFMCPGLDYQVVKSMIEILAPFWKECEDKGEITPDFKKFLQQKQVEGESAGPSVALNNSEEKRAMMKLATPPSTPPISRTSSLENLKKELNPVPINFDEKNFFPQKEESREKQEKKAENESNPASKEMELEEGEEEIVEDESQEEESIVDEEYEDEMEISNESKIKEFISKFTLEKSEESLNTLLVAVSKEKNEPSYLKDLAQTIYEAISFEFADFKCREILQRSKEDESKAPLYFQLFSYAQKLCNQKRLFSELQQMLAILSNLQELEVTLGARLLLYLVGKLRNGKTDLYKEEYIKEDQWNDFLSAIQREKDAGYSFALYGRFVEVEGSLRSKEYFNRDTKLINEADVFVFFSIISIVTKYFPTLSCGNKELVHLVSSTIDASQLHDLTLSLITQETTLFGDSPLDILEESLGWETFDQISLWQLLLAEMKNHSDTKSMQKSTFIPLLSKKIDPNRDYEALNGLLSLFKDLSPNDSLLKCIIGLPTSFARFTTYLLGHWTSLYPDSIKYLAEIVGSVSDTNTAVRYLRQITIWRLKQPDLGVWNSTQPLFHSCSSTLKKLNLQSQFQVLVSVIPPSMLLSPKKAEAEANELDLEDDTQTGPRKRLRRLTQKG